MAEPLRIDVISDIVCPWCFIGARQLMKALDMIDLEVDLAFHPYELNPDMPPEGEDFDAHVARKYGGTDEESPATWDRIRAIGEPLGIDFTHKSTRIWNTAKAHQLIYWARDSGHQKDLELKFFEAYFVHGQCISDDKVLTDIVASVGLDAKEASAVLADGRFRLPVQTMEARWQNMGIQGVPAMIIANKHLVMGAQDAGQLARALPQIAAMADQPSA